MTDPGTTDDVDLLNVDRELTPDERQALKALGERGWEQIMALLIQRSRATYNVAHSRVFTNCVQQHLNHEQRDELIEAEAYACPVCGTLLKDRRSPVASSILLERNRLRGLWMDVEAAPTDEFADRLERFRRALGLDK